MSGVRPPKGSIRIQVTQEDIAESTRLLAQGGHPLLRSCNCPVALGAKRVLTDVNVSGHYLDGNHPKLGFRMWALSERAKQFVKDFDENRPVKPLTFWAQPA